jgi:hypothetical protein
MQRRDRRPQHHQVLPSLPRALQPGDDILPVDVVLHHGREAGVGVLRGYRRRESIAEVEQATGFGLLGTVEVDPAGNRPAVKLAAAHVHAPFELACQQFCDGRLCRRSALP